VANVDDATTTKTARDAMQEKRCPARMAFISVLARRV
jgi:hypothetical protein